MKIYYQGNPGSYMHAASLAIQDDLSVDIESLEGKVDFQDVWDNIGDNGIAVLAIENSYMGSIYPNLHGFLKHDCKIIGDYDGAINHCLCSHESDISNITHAYSQPPALDQCHKYLKKQGIMPKAYSDTALSAKYISESKESGAAAICSEAAANMYNLNILDKHIQDNSGNTTRFAIITSQTSDVTYSKSSHKVSLLIETKNIPASLYKCLGVFATHNINLSKLESIPSFKGAFSCMFWLDLDGDIKDDRVRSAIEELKLFTNEIRTIGAY